MWLIEIVKGYRVGIVEVFILVHSRVSSALR
jgi:hypothetical protein